MWALVVQEWCRRQRRARLLLDLCRLRPLLYLLLLYETLACAVMWGLS